MGLYFTGSILAGMLMGRLIELPVLHLRDRLCPSRSSDLAPAAAPRVAAHDPGSGAAAEPVVAPGLGLSAAVSPAAERS